MYMFKTNKDKNSLLNFISEKLNISRDDLTLFQADVDGRIDTCFVLYSGCNILLQVRINLYDKKVCEIRNFRTGDLLWLN